MPFLLVFPVLVSMFSLVLGGCAATSSHGESLRTPSPPGFVRTERMSTDGLEQVELVPAGQGSSNWTEMVSMQTLKGGVEEGDPVRYAQWAAGRWKDECPSGTVGSVDPTPRNGYPAAFWRMDCPGMASTGKPEHTLTIAIEGNYAFHTVQKTWRSDPAEPEIASWTREFFGAVSVCDAAGHPCAASVAP
jgi:hypothetical protein